MKKRQDLQGIRGLAIASVLLYHFFPEYFRNGYVGVDQFFILSGFLMAEILSREDFLTPSVLYSFYYRRLKRILPLYVLFILITLLLSLKFFEYSNFTYNIPHAIRSLFFVSNTQQEDETQTYEKMLAEAENLFTHTWSLSCEVQFYIMAPFIILTPLFLEKKSFVIVLCISSYVASIFYFLNDLEYFAFNSAFMRIWQFSLGILCSHYHKSSNLNDLKGEALLAYATHRNCDNLPNNTILVSVICLSWYPLEISNHLIRFLLCIQTACLIYSGHNTPNTPLSNRLLVYLGDISYSLYLVHWPIYVYLKQNNYNNIFGSLAGITGSIMLAVFIYETYEKFYLKLEKKATFWLVFSLYLSCFVVLVPHIDFSPAEVSIGGAQGSEYFVLPENLTMETAMKLNTQFSKIDISLLQLKECNYTQFSERETVERWKLCQVNNTAFTGEHRAMFIGNSYAPMMTRLFIKLKECQGKVNDVYIYAKAACEAIDDSPFGHCRNVTNKFYEAVKKIQPDVLFVSAKHTASMSYPPKNGTVDKMLEKEKFYLDRLEKVVKKKVYILNAFPPTILSKYSTILNKSLKEGIPLKHESLLNLKANYKLARNRMAKLAEHCTKCELIDIMPSFLKDGIFETYNEETKVGYFTDPQHLNDYGLQKISPLYRNVCTNM